jgi:hypothetical protein
MLPSGDEIELQVVSLLFLEKKGNFSSYKPTDTSHTINPDRLYIHVSYLLTHDFLITVQEDRG